MGKKVFYGADARERVLKGAEILYNAVKTTMGPKGRNVVIAKNYGPPVITHDGVTVAKSVELTDKEETLGYKVGAELIKTVASKMNDIAGDGTTTVTILTYHILNEANKLVAAGHNPMQLRKGLEKAAEDVLKLLGQLSEKIDGNSKRVAEVATISAGSVEIGKLIAGVIAKIGKDGIVTVEEGQGLELESEIVKGFTFNKGFISPYMVTDTARMEAVYEKVAIVITDAKIRSIHEFLPVLEKLSQAGQKDLVVIADDIEGDALGTLVLNKVKGTFNTVAIKAPTFGDSRKEVLNDLAILTGATVISEDQGITFGNATLDMIGRAKKVIVGRTETTIIDGSGKVTDVTARIKQIREQQSHVDNEFERDRFEQRAADLGGKVAVIKVGGVSETEIEEEKFRVDDAVHAVKAALEDGIVAGGGITMVNLSDNIFSKDEGSQLLKKALMQPFRILMDNSGESPDAWLSGVRKNTGYGIDVTDPNKVVDLKQAGVVDPVKVVKESIQNAVSIAGTALTMGALVVEEPSDTTDLDMPMPPPQFR